ncbi:MAG: hypothetical protein GY820_17060 [Gammaproteobacteria bacterium]|nr:hypothetical protein [Gammaproteobacteria bacterium]
MARMKKDEIDFHCRRYQQLMAGRGTFDNAFQEIAERIYPEHARFTVEGHPGEKLMSKVYDSTGIHANQLLSSGLFSLLTSPANPWFELRTVNPRMMETHAVKVYLADATRAMHHELNKAVAGFATAMHEGYLSYGAFGNMAVFVEEQLDEDALLFLSLPLYECYFVENARDRVDTLYRKYTRTVEQLASKFGAENLSDNTRKLVSDNKLDQNINCYHLVTPRATVNILTGKPSDKPFTSAYIEVKDKHLIREGGFDEQPFMAARFYKSAHETYGRGPGFTTLPDVKMLMRVAQVTIRAAQKTTDPPLLLPDQGFLKPIRTTPGGLNYYRKGRVNTKDDIGLLPTGNPAFGLEYSESLHKRIREAFFVDQLQLNEGPQMTATEVLQRTEEKLRLMGPLLGRIQTELLGPLIRRVHGLLLRHGNKMPAPPQEMGGQPLRIVYTSPIARAQEQVQANGLVRALGILEPLFDRAPQSMDVLDTDEMTRGVFDMFSVNPKFVKDQAAVDAKRQADQEREDRQLQAENLAKAGQGLAGIGSAVKDADMDDADIANLGPGEGGFLQ